MCGLPWQIDWPELKTLVWKFVCGIWENLAQAVFVNSDQNVEMYLTLWPWCLCVNQSYYRTHIAMSCTLKDSSLKDESSWIFVISAPPPCLLALPAQRFCRLMSGGSGRGLGDRRWCLLPTLKSPHWLTHSSTQLFGVLSIYCIVPLNYLVCVLYTSLRSALHWKPRDGAYHSKSMHCCFTPSSTSAVLMHIAQCSSNLDGCWIIALSWQFHAQMQIIGRQSTKNSIIC